MTRKEQKEQKRILILQTALHLFVQQGYYGTKTCQISREAKISEGLLFHYFPTKENLLEELVKLAVAGMQYPMQLHTETPIQFFEVFTTQLFQYLQENPFSAELFVLMTQVLRREGFPARIRELAASVDMISATQKLIEEGQAAGCIRQGNSLALANFFWCSIQGIAEQYAARPELPLPEVTWVVACLKPEKEQ